MVIVVIVDITAIMVILVIKVVMVVRLKNKRADTLNRLSITPAKVKPVLSCISGMISSSIY